MYKIKQVCDVFVKFDYPDTENQIENYNVNQIIEL